MSGKGYGYAFLSGALIGAAVGLLFAPKKGSELRTDIKIKGDEYKDRIASYDYAAKKEAIQTKVDSFKESVKDLDKDKIKDISLESLNNLNVKAKELSESAKRGFKKNSEEPSNTFEDLVEDVEATDDLTSELEKDLFDEI